MSLALVRSRALAAGHTPEIKVEVHLANGLPAFAIVGLPDLEVRESRERVRAALQNSGFEFPARRITVNLAPADLPKASGHFDLPIALGILAASEQLPAGALAGREFAGELSLSGALRPIHGAFAMACGLARRRAGRPDSGSNRTAALPEFFLPLANAATAALVPGVCVYGAADLASLCAHLADKPSGRLSPAQPAPATAVPDPPDMAEVIGQTGAKRALEVAAAGAHHILLVGPPGAGKSMLAARLPGIQPPMTDDEALACAALLSATRVGFTPQMWRRRPFRAPHHSASAAALIGGGNPPSAGEISLAHLGILFLDELPEFDRRVLEMLREPLENGHITISRAGRQVEFPAAAQLIAAMNPCPCGWYGDPRGLCRCSPEQAARYRNKLSGPLLDRIDIQIALPALTPHELAEPQTGDAERSASIARRVAAARCKQFERQNCSNQALPSRDIERVCRPEPAARTLLETAGHRFGWSARAHYRVLKVARTIADLAGSPQPELAHIAEAIRYRTAFQSA
jgi:magnesium chelatase family protein